MGTDSAADRLYTNVASITSRHHLKCLERDGRQPREVDNLSHIDRGSLRIPSSSTSMAAECQDRQQGHI